LSSEQSRVAAVASLEKYFYAASSAAAVRARRKCYIDILAQWSREPFPISTASLRCLGAGLKAGKYRSAASIVSQYKVDGERAGQTLSGNMLRMISDVNRSCLRGLGPPTQASPLPFERLGSLPGGVAAWTRCGPIGARNAVVCGSWWMLREAELSNLRARFAWLDKEGVPTVTLYLPASKNDTSAQGTRRAHACVCQGGLSFPTALCTQSGTRSCPSRRCCRTASGRTGRILRCRFSHEQTAAQRARAASRRPLFEQLRSWAPRS